MLNSLLTTTKITEKQPEFGMDNVFNGQFKEKVSVGLMQYSQKNSLSAWVVLYFKLHVIGGAPVKTQQAKKCDLEKFMQFFTKELGHEQIDGWTSAVTKALPNELSTAKSPISGNHYQVTTVNRIMATVRYFAGWLIKQRPLMAGDHLAGVKDLHCDEPEWNGLNNIQILRLKPAIEQRIKACGKQNQNSLLEAAVFYLLLQTGLRESELVALNLGQYYNKSLYQVLRTKNKRVSGKVPVPQGAECLERYLAFSADATLPEAPLFKSRYGKRLKAQDLFRICKSLAKQTAVFLEPGQPFRFTPQKLQESIEALFIT